MFVGQWKPTVICAVAAFGGWTTGFTQETKETVMVRDLNALAALLGRDLGEHELRTLRAFSKDKREPIKLLVAAILYRHDTAQHRDLLFSRFAIHDYKARKSGVYNIKPANEVLTSIRQIQEKHLKSKRSVVLLLVFSHYHDKNVWFMLKDQKFSAARFFRAAFFADAFRGSELDAADVANEIDKNTSEVDLKD